MDETATETTQGAVRNITFALLSRTADKDYAIGHAWIEWGSLREEGRCFRGYFPDWSDVPSDLQKRLADDIDEWLAYFPSNAVPGRFERDFYASELRARGRSILSKTWELHDGELRRVEERCFIPLGRDSVPDGLYSWNENKPDEHNCSSWAISAVNHSKGNPSFLRCDRPKRLIHVERCFWGKNP